MTARAPTEVLFCSDTFWEAWGDEVLAIDPSIDSVRLVGAERLTPDDLERPTIAFFSPDLWPDRAASFMGTAIRLPNLRWLHTMSAGTDHPVFGMLRDGGATITNSSGAAAPSIAQTVMLYLLALSRDLPRLTRAQSACRWEPAPSRDLADVRLGIVGLGAIGGEVARLADAFGMDVVATRRRPTGDEPCTTWSADRLTDLLGWGDAIVVTAPLTSATRDLFDATGFAAMRPGSWFVNVGRGEIVDEPALIDALASGHLAGAGLDVFSTEPLPPDSPLWSMPNIIVTPHSSGTTDRTRRRAIELFLGNLRRRTAGEPLANVIE